FLKRIAGRAGRKHPQRKCLLRGVENGPLGTALNEDDPVAVAVEPGWPQRDRSPCGLRHFRGKASQRVRRRRGAFVTGANGRTSPRTGSSGIYGSCNSFFRSAALVLPTGTLSVGFSSNKTAAGLDNRFFGCAPCRARGTFSATSVSCSSSGRT